MIDTHCHIDFEDFDEDRTDVIKRAQDKLDYVVASGFDKQSNEKVLALSKEYEGFFYPTFGFHPVSSQKSTDDELKEAQNHLIDNLSNIVAIGEVGMDYYYVKDKALREKQKEIFLTFIDIANEFRHKIGSMETTEVTAFRFFIVTNKTLSYRVKSLEQEPLLGRPSILQVWTLERFYDNFRSCLFIKSTPFFVYTH